MSKKKTKSATTPYEKNAGKTCKVAKCKRPARAKGLCGAHYVRARRGNVLTAPLRGYTRAAKKQSAPKAKKAA